MLAPLAIASLWVLSNVESSTAGNADVVVEVQQGWTPAQVGDTLRGAGRDRVVGGVPAGRREPRSSRRYVAGRYDFVENSDPREALDTLRGGPRRNIPDLELLLPPGLTLQQIADRVGKLRGQERAARSSRPRSPTPSGHATNRPR